MKTAKPAAAAEAPSSSHRRSQPVRQTRTNPPRTSSGLSRTASGTLVGASTQDQHIDIFPGVTHFADAITALPKELVRHFTLLKEVDAKIFAPEEALFQLVDAALKAPAPEATRAINDAATSVVLASTPMSAQNSSNSALISARPAAQDDPAHTAVFAPGNLPRRQLFRQTAFKIQEMILSLEEKNHVISTANDALARQLARIDDIWPHLETEFSDEAKWGSTAHWAYVGNRMARANNTQAERSRREGAATLSAAAQQLAEEAAARSETRKQAVAAKKLSRHQHSHESDLDLRTADQHKKAQSGSKPKAQKGPADSPANVGLGISAPATVNGNADKKRRKTEKPANGALPTERAMSTVFGASTAKPKAGSPRETPGPDGAPKKRKALPSSGNQAKKSRTGQAGSPSAASSPVIGTFPDATKPGRNSPTPAGNPRPATSRARQNSTHSNVDNGRQRPASSASNKPNGLGLGPVDLPISSNGAKGPSEAKAQKDHTVIPNAEVAKADVEAQAAQQASPLLNGIKPDVVMKAVGEPEAKKEAAAAVIPPPPPPVTTTVTTKSGRASKPSTPALSTFAEAAVSKPRPSRASESSGSTTTKRSHKKGASQTAAAMQAIMSQAAAGSGAEKVTTAGAAPEKRQDGSNNGNNGGKPQPQDDDDEEDIEADGDEPRYCYCNQVSYGEMVACDAEGCEREWFHLGCVGLKVAPKGNAKWYCDNCIKRLKLQGKKVNGR